MNTMRCLAAAVNVMSALLGVGQACAADCRITTGKVAGSVVATLATGVLSVDSRSRSILVFDTFLPVTTDGAPDSYGPDDQGGRRGINTICNAVTIYRLNSAGDRVGTLRQCPEIRKVFHSFRVAGWTDPPGYDVAWQGGFVAKMDGDREIPCVFTTGSYAGYLASKTNLKNGLDTDAGECGINDQIDPRKVPGITIEGGRNFIRDSGVQLGDLAVASYTNKDGNSRHSFAVVIDSGGITAPAMGTIALNAELLHRDGPFDTPQRVQSLQIGTPGRIQPNQTPNPRGQTPYPDLVRVIIIPGSFGYHLAQPYTYENINQRWDAFLRGADLKSPDDLAARVACR